MIMTSKYSDVKLTDLKMSIHTKFHDNTISQVRDIDKTLKRRHLNDNCLGVAWVGSD